MGKMFGEMFNDPRVHLRDAVELSDRLFKRPTDEALALRLAIKVQALDEAVKHGGYKLVKK